MRARWQRLRCKGLLGVWAVFLLMAAMLFAERSGIRTRLERPGRSYLTRETTLTAAQVMEAVSDFEKGNMRLSAVLAAMTPPKA